MRDRIDENSRFMGPHSNGIWKASRLNPLHDLTELRFWAVYVAKEQDAMNLYIYRVILVSNGCTW